MRRLVAIAASVLLLGLSGCQTAANAKLLLPPGWVGMKHAAPNVVVSADATLQEAQQAVALRAEARRTLQAVFDEVRSEPTHYFCRDEACYQRFGGSTSLAKAFGNSRTLISPAGSRASILAHEWWHTELFERLGWRRVRTLPRWFDEGIAVWVSADARHGAAMYQRVLAEGITPPTLAELESVEGFFAAIERYGDHRWASKPADAVTVVYPTVGHEAYRWMGLVGVAGLHELLARLEQGEDFHAAYAAIETRAMPRSAPAGGSLSKTH